MKITEKTKINEILESKPESIEIFMEVGLGCVSCHFSQFETLGDGLKVHGFSEKATREIIKELNKNGK